MSAAVGWLNRRAGNAPVFLRKLERFSCIKVAQLILGAASPANFDNLGEFL